MSTAEFELRYEGPALEAGYMETGELARALFAMNKLLRETNRIVNGDRYSVQTNVHSGFKRGSFGIEFSLELTSHIGTASGILDEAGVNSAEQILVLLGISESTMVRGIWQLLKRFMGGRVRPGDIRMGGVNPQQFSGNNQSINIVNNIQNTYNSFPVRQSFEGITTPLKQNGIEILQAWQAGKVNAEIEKGDLSSYESDKVISDSHVVEGANETTREALLQLNRPVLRGDYVWNVSELGASFSARMLDSEFRKRVENGDVRFGAGDVLRVRLRRIPRITESGQLTADSEILEVLQHIPVQHFRQARLTDGDPG